MKIREVRVCALTKLAAKKTTRKSVESSIGTALDIAVGGSKGAAAGTVI